MNYCLICGEKPVLLYIHMGAYKLYTIIIPHNSGCIFNLPNLYGFQLSPYIFQFTYNCSLTVAHSFLFKCCCENINKSIIKVCSKQKLSLVHFTFIGVNFLTKSIDLLCISKSSLVAGPDLNFLETKLHPGLWLALPRYLKTGLLLVMTAKCSKSDTMIINCWTVYIIHSAAFTINCLRQRPFRSSFDYNWSSHHHQQKTFIQGRFNK